jgi:hypothetical protein
MGMSGLCCTLVPFIAGLALLVAGTRKGNPFQENPLALPVALGGTVIPPLLLTLFYLYQSANNGRLFQGFGVFEIIFLGIFTLGWGSLIFGLVAFYFRKK